MKKDNNYSRRQFLGTASCAAVGSTTFFSTLFNLQSMSAASMMNTAALGVDDDYRALVCIMLGGGNDSYNMVIPTNNEHYKDYAASRSNNAIAQNELLKINPLKYNNKELGFHPVAPELQSLFERGKLAVVSNVGTLVERVTKATYDNGARLPNGLFSHADQDKQWLTSIPQTSASTGWGGRLADMVHSANTNQNISMNISLSGKNVFQLGRETAEYSILPTGSIGIEGYDGSSALDQIRTVAIKSMMEKQYQDIFKQSYADVIKSSQSTHELFSAAVADAKISTPFSESGLSQRLKMVARTMKARSKLGARRQTFFMRFDGWDHHDELLNNHQSMLGVVSKAMSEFQVALEELKLEDSVTTFTVSDFARTLTSNGNGTDHAWGGNVLVMGGKVKGREIYGDYPNLALNNDIMLDGGVLIPQISTDEYFSELALWYGVGRGDLETLFPNINKFYSPSSNSQPLGFMNI
ncbi:MAG: DUF1501 domain-containing protein [Bacteroidetes bacterium]|nr:DUF1501 domain-containing protein [Bacteroidota bacterium]